MRYDAHRPPATVKPTLAGHTKPLLYGVFYFWGLSIFCILADLAFEEASHFVLAVLISLSFIVGGLALAFFLVRYRSANFFTPVPWFFVSISVFFGIGSLYPLFGDELGIRRIEFIAPVGPSPVFSANLMNLLGISILMATFYIVSWWLPGMGNKLSIKDEHYAGLKKMTILFLGIGGALKYLILLPYSLGLLTFVLPGAIGSQIIIFYTGLMFSAFLGFREKGMWWFIFITLFVVELLVGLLTLSKTSLLLVPMFSIVGIFMARPRIRYLLVAGLGVVALYIVTKPLVNQGRIILRQGVGKAGLEARSSIMQSAFIEENSGSRNKRHYSWWLRLCYTPVQVYAINQYRNGMVFDSFDTLPYVVVPRFLYPEKPNMSKVGIDFNEMVFGFRSSSLALSPYAEAYWNGGYFYLVLVSIYIGTLFALLSSFTLHIIRNGLWIFAPVMLNSIDTGRSVTGWFVLTYVGGVVILLGTFGLLLVVHLLTKGKKTKAPETKGARPPRRRALPQLSRR